MSIEPVDEAELAKASAEAAAAAADGARGSQDDWVQRTPPPSMDVYLPVLYLAAALSSAFLLACPVLLRVRLQIIRNACTSNVCKYQSCMVSKLRMIWKRTRSNTRQASRKADESAAAR